MIIIVLISSCTQKTLRFTTYQSKYNIKLPRGYALKKTVDYHGSKEYQAVYADSSVVCILQMIWYLAETIIAKQKNMAMALI